MIYVLFVFVVFVCAGVISANIQLNIMLKRLNEKKILDEKIKDGNRFIEDVMNYTFEKKLPCIIMPNTDGKQTLYHVDDERKQQNIICEIFNVGNKPGSKEYNEFLKSVTDRIDGYIERMIERLQTNATN